MNKKALYWIVGIVIIVIIIIVVAVSSGGHSSNPSAQAPSDDQAKATVAGNVRQSMHDLIASGATQTCTFSIPATSTSSSMSGTIYMASGSMKGDFLTTNTSGKATSSHMIIAAGEVYLWADALSRGAKLPWTLAASSTSLLNKQGGINIDQPASYSCTNAAPAQSEFTIPTDTQFIDISSYIRK